MTLEEAKKEIAGRKAMYDSIVDRISDPYNTARDFYKGEASGLSEAIDILANVDTKPVGNPDKLTLTELAHELRKIILFDHLTISPDICGQPLKVYAWLGRPHYEDKGRMWLSSQRDDAIVVFHFETWNLKFCVVDLSEYADADSNIDYSRCIVEVE